MIINKELGIRKIVYIQSQSAEAAPPLGTILGNVGVNTIKFCDEFNKFTKTLPSYLIVKVQININENKSFTFSIISISITYILKLLKFKTTIKVRLNDRFVEQDLMCIKLKDILILSLYKFPNKDLMESFNIIFGIIKSMNLFIIK